MHKGVESGMNSPNFAVRMGEAKTCEQKTALHSDQTDELQLIAPYYPYYHSHATTNA